MAKNKKRANNRLKYNILLVLAGFFIAAIFFIFAYEFFFLAHHVKPPRQYTVFKKINKTELKVALYKQHPIKNVMFFFNKTLQGFGIIDRNVVIKHVVLSIKAPVNKKDGLKNITVNFLKYDVLISSGLDFNLIKNAFRTEFEKYILPSGSPISYYLYTVKNNTLCIYFYYKSRLFLKAVFIVEGVNNSGFNSIIQYVNAPKISLNIDDVGYDVAFIQSLVSLHTPITFAIFPYAPFSDQIDMMLHKLGYETIMHTPMEPVNIKLFPGDGALFISMDKQEIKNKIFTDIGMLPFINGANNHEGSLFTSDKNKICDAISAFKEKGLFFMDSLTDVNSYAYRCALKNGLPSAQRDVFIDDKSPDGYIERQINTATSMTDRFKRVIIIGHPRPNTVRVLMMEIPKLKKEGYFFVPLCEFLR